MQAIFNSLEGFSGQTLVIGGDGRFYNREAIQKAIRHRAGQRLRPHCGRPRRPVVDAGRLRADPQSSHASAASSSPLRHNPGGPDGDFGIKYNIGNGGPAPEKITDAIYAQTKTIDSYKTLDAPDVDLDALGVTALGGGTVEIVDPVTNYAALMRTSVQFRRHPRPVRLRLPHALRRHARDHRPLRPRHPRGRARRGRRHGGQRNAAAPISAVTIPTPTSPTPRTSTTC